MPANDGWVYATMLQVRSLPRGVVSVHCENTEIARWIKDEVVATGRQDLGAYTESRPAFCEEETIKRMIFLAEKTGCPLRGRGLDVTIETCPHYLTRTAYDEDLDMRAKISPPLRDREQLEGLWDAMLKGTVWSIGSDHVPFFPKKGEDLWDELPGIVTFPWETALLLHHGVHERGLPLTELVRMNSFAPAKRFGLYPNKGSLEVGSDADLVIVDIDEERQVVHDGHGTCIYEGMKLKGWPVLTVSRGRVVYENGEVDEDAFGRGQCLTRPDT